MATIHIMVQGKVQGVFYRASAKEKADRLGITGWVQNAESGEVEIMASGSSEKLERFVLWCKQGPSRAVVTQVVVTSVDEIAFDQFVVRRGM